MIPYRAALYLLLCTAAWGAAPSYSAAGIVNAGNFTAGPFAPNSILTIFGSNLATPGVQATGSIVGGALSDEIAYTRVFCDNIPAPLFYVSENQINFLVSSTQSVGNMKIRVAHQSNSGPEVTVTIVDAAPALFKTSAGYAIATHVDNSLVTDDSPAHAGEIIVVYCTGLGKTIPNPNSGEAPRNAASIAALGTLQILLDGAPIDPILIKYAGLTPYFVGLYQINMEVPAKPGTNPELRVTVAGQTSASGVLLAIR